MKILKELNKMIKQCEICNSNFETVPGGNSRKYCFECSPSYPKGGSRAKTISALRKAMKKEAIRRKGSKCEICGYNKCIAALNFHHLDASQKEFGLAQSGVVHSWTEFWNEVQKCQLLCANCHAEIHNMEE